MAIVVEGRIYNTLQATLLAEDASWEGHDLEHPGHRTYLFRSPRGDYFAEHRSAWHVEYDWLEPLSWLDAIRLYEELPVRKVDFEEAFPPSGER
jgi:hypothetical protein